MTPADVLNDVEVRILGCLLEKQIATPEYYPLTLNSLTNACNQKSNRNPLVAFDVKTVARGLDGLRQKGFARVVHLAGTRVPKYEHSLPDKISISPAETAVLCELMLRGFQTPGELRGRASRFCEFGSLDEVEAVLAGLQEEGREEPLVMKLPRQPGRKENRFAHLLGGVPAVPEDTPRVSVETATVEVWAENERIRVLEEKVGLLENEMRELRRRFEAFKAGFE